MKEFVAYLVKNLVSKPNDVTVSDEEVNGLIRIEIRVADEDAGKVIGKGGKTINALRTIARTVATRLGKKVHVELIQNEQPIQTFEEVPAEDFVQESPAFV